MSRNPCFEIGPTKRPKGSKTGAKWDPFWVWEGGPKGESYRGTLFVDVHVAVYMHMQMPSYMKMQM